MRLNISILSISAALVLTACGGGGGGANPSTTPIESQPHIKAMVDGKEYKVDANLSAGIDPEDGVFLIDGHNATGPVVDKGWSIALMKKEVGVTYPCKEDETEMLFGYSSGGKFFLYLGDGLDGSNCKVTVTSITAKEVTGTFSGKLAGYDETGQNLTGKFANVTNGSFRVPVQEIK